MSLLKGKRQTGALALAGSVQASTGLLVGTVMAVYLGRVGSPFAVGLAVTAFSLGMLFFSPIWGAVADITGRRRTVLVITTALATAAIVPLAIFQSVPAQIGLRGAYAVFWAGFGPVVLSIVSARGGAEARGHSIGFFNSARAVGQASGQFLSGLLLTVFAPTQLYLLIATISLVATLLTFLIDDPTPTPPSVSLAELRQEIRRRLLPSDVTHLRVNGLA